MDNLSELLTWLRGKDVKLTLSCDEDGIVYARLSTIVGQKRLDAHVGMGMHEIALAKINLLLAELDHVYHQLEEERQKFVVTKD